MNIPLLSLSILDPLYSLFGAVMRFIYIVFGNYGLSIILFTVLVRLILLPFNVKQHKSSLQQRALQPQLRDLQRYYGNDREGFAQAQMALYEKNNVSLMGGCLPALISLIIMWPIYRIVSGPLYFIKQISEDNLKQICDILINAGLVDAGKATMNLPHNNIFIAELLRDNPSVFAQVVDQGLMSVNQLLDMNLFGVNLGLTPTLNFNLLFGQEMSTYLPLLIFPVLSLVTSIFSMKYTQKVSGTGMSKKEKKEQKEKQEKNPALQQEADLEKTNKVMLYMMPIMTVIFTFNMPAAMSVYWITGNLLAMFQSWLFDKIYTKPLLARQAEADAEFEQQINERVKREKEVLEKIENESGKKKRRKRTN